MTNSTAISEEKILSIIDLGSNSLRMIIVRIAGNRVSNVLNQVKHMVRLGEGAFESSRLQPIPMQRTLDALKSFSGMCRSYNVVEIVALATAAVRDTHNGQDFIDRIYREAGISFTVISGREEARLICKGVSAALEPTSKKRMFIDIGGGSTEISVADGKNILELESLTLGAVRLSELFPCSDVVSASMYGNVQQYIRNHAVLPLQRLKRQSPAELIGSSGTIQNLAAMAAAMDRADGKLSENSAEILSYKGLRRVVAALCGCREEDRKYLPGIHPRRTSILIPGAAILQTVMEEMNISSIQVSNKGLRDGAIIDYMERMAIDPDNLSIRDDSIFRLATSCHFEEAHSRHVAKLACMLFDSARNIGIYAGNISTRKILYYSAILHDIGIFIAFSKHNYHSYYLIKNTELLGFTQDEITFMAILAFLHRYGYRKKDISAIDIPNHLQEDIKIFSCFLSLAEAMDKSHRQAVDSAHVIRKNNRIELAIHASQPCPIEQDRLKKCMKPLEKYLGIRDVEWT